MVINPRQHITVVIEALYPFHDILCRLFINGAFRSVFIDKIFSTRLEISCIPNTEGIIRVIGQCKRRNILRQRILALFQQCIEVFRTLNCLYLFFGNASLFEQIQVVIHHFRMGV